MATALEDYFDALERLKKNKPLKVPKGTKISNDTVALEAGRGRGSIKKSRALFSDLIVAIDRAASEQKDQQASGDTALNKAKERANRYQRLYEEGMARELSMLKEIEALKAENRKLRQSAVRRVK